MEFYSEAATLIMKAAESVGIEGPDPKAVAGVFELLWENNLEQDPRAQALLEEYREGIDEALDDRAAGERAVDAIIDLYARDRTDPSELRVNIDFAAGTHNPIEEPTGGAECEAFEYEDLRRRLAVFQEFVNMET